MEECLFLYKFGTLVSKYIITVTPATKKTEAEDYILTFSYMNLILLKAVETKVLELSNLLKPWRAQAYEKDSVRRR